MISVAILSSSGDGHEMTTLDSLKEDKSSKPPQPPSETKELPCSAIVIVEAKDETVHEPGSSSTETGTEEIVRELRKVKRQNSITHWLLSVMIILTAVWQLSEVSLILAVKNRVTDPFRSFGSMVKGMLKVCGVNERVEAKMKPSSSTKKPQIEAPSLPAFKIPELDLPVLGLNSEED
ncbi:hypothetical protein HHK36_015852 [Tetracentron sinense]|uniref:Uncharacterized protein n=1 Tax=Tetracentron sinense TaxID=13715 RepID=A0A835DH74_TETSI|nr:hypothetical protein HHK36_015852 [Tetracentron sinense]